ncbi:hypothetical protein PsorP6_009786 [Peronosclerospora sorghi]|uniref:Uncharacterized protein n=1 Tax=Peronosclerospora sorghi TaxID=230839 RepID=A0ACC0VYQ4_9STRA|nr:hypothetical protein PsorP6_009786 [Peronosclerospora sorghi]
MESVHEIKLDLTFSGVVIRQRGREESERERRSHHTTNDIMRCSCPEPRHCHFRVPSSTRIGCPFRAF